MNKLRFIVLIVVLLVVSFAHPTPSYGQATPNTTPINIQGFHLVSPTEGWVWMAHLYWTKDAGQTWIDITPPHQNDAGLAGVSFIDNQNGAVILISQGSDMRLSYTLARTSNAGKTWVIIPITLFSGRDIDIYSGQISSWQFIDVNTGWVMVQAPSSSNFDVGTLFKTSDGGINWTRLTTPISRSGTPIGDRAYFVTDQNGWIAGRAEGYQPEDNLFYRTQDGGQTWQTQSVGVLPTTPARRIYSIPQFVNPQDGLLNISVVHGKNVSLEVYITHDAGVTWQLDSTLAGAGTAILLDRTHWIGTIPGVKVVQRTTTQEASPLTLNQDISATHIVSASFISAEVGLAESITFNPITALSPIELLYTNDGGNAWQHLVLPETSSGPVKSTVLSSVVLTSQIFDTCDAPTLDTMTYWSTHGEYGNPPYVGVNLYIGDPNKSSKGYYYRACANGNINAAYILGLSRQGWKIIPTWVGLQGSGGSSATYLDTISADLKVAQGQGIMAANNAADTGVGLGLGGSVIYYDLEDYNTSIPSYVQSAQAFIAGWSSQLHARGFKAGIYASTLGSRIIDFVNLSNSPDVAWIAQTYYCPGTDPNLKQFCYDPNAVVKPISSLDNNGWPIHQRIHQYAGAHCVFPPCNNTNPNGLSIDSDAMDGVVATQVLTPGVPAIIAPANGTTLPNITTSVTFVIQAGSPDYRGVMNWEVQVATDPNFTQPILIDYTSLLPSISVAQLGHGILYYVRVRQSDQQPQGVTPAPPISAWSPIITFRIAP